MSSVVRLTLHADANAKVTPLELLRDFADATRGWSYLEADSRHYSDVKEAPGLVLRHRPSTSSFVDLGFVQTSSKDHTVELAVLDRPDSETPLTQDERTGLIDTFLGVMRDYLDERPDHVTLRVEEDRPDPATS